MVMTSPPPRITKPQFQLSEYQEAILDAVVNTNDNLMVEACAGSGKTTTLKLICDHIPKDTRAIAVCFNKIIATEFKRKLPPHVDAQTLHSVGFRTIQNLYSRIQVNRDKVFEYTKKVYLPKYERNTGVEIPFKTKKRIMAMMQPAVSMVLATMTDYKQMNMVIEALDESAADVPIDVTPHIAPVIEYCRGEQRIISFDDMIDHPLHHEYPLPQYELIMVDESQDLNLQQIEFVSRMLLPGGRLIVVGDSHQAIYAFRGADRNAMELMRTRFNCRVLPLSVCYRCGTDIVAKAQEIVTADVIKPHDSMPAGTVIRKLPEDMEQTIDELQPGDMVLCRTNAPLIAPCFQLIREGKYCVIRGNDIGAALIRLISEVTGLYNSIRYASEFTIRLNSYVNNRIIDLEQEKRKKAINYLEEQRETLIAIAENCETVSDIERRINQIFSDYTEDQQHRKAIVFSSIHRAKGLETSTVVFLGPELIPNKFAVTDEELRQEENLRYVATTRAIDTLIYQPLSNQE